ncbi:PIG-L deacetylase family protein [Arthrobacter sp. TMP15]|uniref:PIG-L deacetylase family protein n=1 Tax=Arthrobacter sp. TMP15 TaxID=3140789 RepID=UPI0031BB9A0C
MVIPYRNISMVGEKLMTALLEFPQDWQRALIIVAHPDDPEYGMAAAVAQWLAAGKEVSYVLATRGEAGIAGLAPEKSGPLRTREQENACAVIGVSDLVILDHPDGRILEGLALRRDLARQIRRVRPDVVLTLNHRDEWGPGRWNTADHRAVGRAVLDAVADADNEWIFPELLEEGFARHKTRWVALSSPQPTHAQTVSAESIEMAVASLAEHKEYLVALSADPVVDQARKQVERVTEGGTVDFELYG